MTSDEMERAIQFILEQQARADARIEANHEETQRQIRALALEADRRDRRLSVKIDKLVEGARALKEATRALIEHARLTDLRLDRLEGQEG